MRIGPKSIALACSLLSASLCCVGPQAATAGEGWVAKHRAEIVAARQRFFGAENVDPLSGWVRDDKVIFSWLTNSTLAVSVKGHVILLDTYINRLEIAPPDGAVDLRRTPINVDDLVALDPQAIFLGHGHGDHADNAAYIAKWLDIPVYSSPETCDVLQLDVARLAADPNTANGGKKLVPNANPIKCIPTVSRGSVPGSEILTIKELEPIACIVVFKHIHSGSAPHDATFPYFPVTNDSDSREAQIYPPGTCVTPKTPNGLQGCLGTPPFTTPVAGQENLTTTGFGSVTGSPGGPISLFYQFILRGKHNFTFVWNNTAGPLKEGLGSDPGLPSPAVGAHLFSIMDSLPQTNVELGSIVSLGYTTNGVRDAILYQQHLKPQIYVPLHMTDVAAVSSSLQWKKSYLQAMVASGTPMPELRWMVDPDDFGKAQVYDPSDERWDIAGRKERVKQFCKNQ